MISNKNYKLKIVENMNDELLSRMFEDNYEVYVKPGTYAMSSKKIESLIKIAELQKYYQCNPVKFIDDFFNIELLDAQALVVMKAWNCPNVLVVASRGFGKALDLETDIPTPSGSRKLKNIHVGDTIYAADGSPTKVIYESPIYLNHDCYEVTFSDGEKIIADAEHLWQVEIGSKSDTLTTFELSQDYHKMGSCNGQPVHNYKYKVNIPGPLYIPKHRPYPIDPYILGLWLGAGYSSNSYIIIPTLDTNEIVERIRERGYQVHSVANDSNGYKKISIYMPNGKPLISRLRSLGLYSNKFIPDEYLNGNIEQRLSFLQGLMDSSGTISEKGFCSFIRDKKQRDIVEGVRKLIESLGIKASISDKESEKVNSASPYTEVCFYSDKQIPVFQLERKKKRLLTERSTLSKRKTIVEVKEVKSVPVKCLMVNNKDHLFLCGEHNTVTHNSTVIDLIIMAKDMLFSNYWCYIASGSGGQAEQTFATLEKIANDNIDEMKGSTGYIFKNEIEIHNSIGDGFSHSSNGFTYSLYNGSMTKTLNSNIDSKRGFRGSVIFDESGFLSAEMMKVYGAFAIVNKDFATGKDRDGNSINPILQRTFPSNIPNQKFYISSASSTETEFYRLYREFSKRQLMGDPDYCVLHIDCEVALHPTMKGERVRPLLTKSTVETEMRTNPEKARREYYCEFTTDAGVSAIVKRGAIARNEEVRKPLLYNDTGDKKFIISYDPARSRDNSVVTVCEVYTVLENNVLDTRMRIVNCINLLDVGKKIKSPMQTPDQVEYLKEIILEYNGGADAYENIIGIYIDAGSGGSGVNIADYLMPDWVGKDGIVHRGLIDKEYSADYIKKFPNAVDKVHLMSPSGYKSEMFETMIELINQNKVSFTSTYDNKGYLTVFDVDEKKLQIEKQRIMNRLKNEKLDGLELENRLKEELSESDSIKTKTIRLNWQEELALANIDALKEELINMVRKPRESGKDSFELCPEKANKLHDDRAYTLAMCSYGLSQLRRKKLIESKRHTSDPKKMVGISKKSKFRKRR